MSIISVIPWVFFYKANDAMLLSYWHLVFAIIIFILFLGSVYGKLSFKPYRLVMIINVMLLLSSPTFVLGKNSVAAVGLLFSPIGMILIFSAKEKKAYFQIIGLITAYYVFIIFWLIYTEPIFELDDQTLGYLNIGNLINYMVAAIIMSLVYFTENSKLQSKLTFERQKSDNLLLKIFPESIANRLKKSNNSIVDTFPDVTVIFIDVVSFTKYADTMSAIELVTMLDELFSDFDTVAKKYRIEKIKTIGDAYMAVAGLPEEDSIHHIHAAKFVLEINELVKSKYKSKYKIQVRIGMHTGSVIAGVIGKSKFSYDLWGSVVNVASRFESHGIPDQVHITKEVKDLLEDKFSIRDNGSIFIKGLGEKDSYFLEEKASSNSSKKAEISSPVLHRKGQS